jgi:membrane carboxypeptidase/penicillin-binding protein
MLTKPMSADPYLEALLEKARSAPPMTAEQRAAQRKSWVIGELMLDDETLTREEAEARYERAIR